MSENTVTEAEARRKMWCPLTIRPAGPWQTCVASDCMAWRWTGFERKIGDADVGEPTGYCGLAGKPNHE